MAMPSDVERDIDAIRLPRWGRVVEVDGVVPYEVQDADDRPIEPVPQMFEKTLPHANYWHVKNYSRDEDPASGVISTFPVPMDFGLINYRAAITRALELGFRGAFLCEHYGSDSLGVIARNRRYIRDVLDTLLD